MPVAHSLKTALLIFVLLLLPEIANASDCLFAPAANQPPKVPKALLASQQFIVAGPTWARYVGVLRSGEVLLSTHMACENRGADVKLIMPNDIYSKKKDLREDILNVLTWYMGTDSARALRANLGSEKIQSGWKRKLEAPEKPGRSFDWVDIAVSDFADSYTMIEFSYYTWK